MGRMGADHALFGPVHAVRWQHGQSADPVVSAAGGGEVHRGGWHRDRRGEPVAILEPVALAHESTERSCVLCVLYAAWHTPAARHRALGSSCAFLRPPPASCPHGATVTVTS